MWIENTIQSQFPTEPMRCYGHYFPGDWVGQIRLLCVSALKGAGGGLRSPSSVYAKLGEPHPDPTVPLRTAIFLSFSSPPSSSLSSSSKPGAYITHNATQPASVWSDVVVRCQWLTLAHTSSFFTLLLLLALKPSVGDAARVRLDPDSGNLFPSETGSYRLIPAIPPARQSRPFTSVKPTPWLLQTLICV